MKLPKPGEIWEINMWSPEGNNTFCVLVLREIDVLQHPNWTSEEHVWECLQGDNITNMPVWMFANAILISGENKTI